VTTDCYTLENLADGASSEKTAEKTDDRTFDEKASERARLAGLESIANSEQKSSDGLAL